MISLDELNNIVDFIRVLRQYQTQTIMMLFYRCIWKSFNQMPKLSNRTQGDPTIRQRSPSELVLADFTCDQPDEEKQYWKDYFRQLDACMTASNTRPHPRRRNKSSIKR
jgi:hypothetical protein